MRLSSDKTEMLLVGLDSTLEVDCDLKLDGVIFPKKDHVCSLGVLLDLALLLDIKVAAVVRGAYY